MLLYVFQLIKTMNNLNRTIILISSMNKPEKRSFKLYCNTQAGEKAYVKLFDIIDKSNAMEYDVIEKSLRNVCNFRSFEIVTSYLYKILIDFLVFKLPEKRIQSKIYQLIERANILFERKLFDEAFGELKNAEEHAVLYEDDVMQVLISRTKMRFLSILDFPKISEKELVAQQVKLSEQIIYARRINQYNYLLDILNHRLLYKGLANSREKIDELNDLVLSELYLVSNNPKIDFQTQMLHLLFQSSYHLEVGDYALAIRNYKYLINLFTDNVNLMLNPPVYYLSAIEGILDSLLSIGIYSEMPHFLGILRQLYKSEYPADFHLKILWLDYFFQSLIILNTGTYEQISSLQEYFEEVLLKKTPYLPLDIQLQFYLINTLFLLSQKKYKDAKKTLMNIFSEGKVFQRLPMFRMTRLVNILICAELGDFDFVETEVVAFKRNVGTSSLSKTEKIILKFALSYPLPRFSHSKEKLWKYYKRKIDSIKGDKYERKLLKYFNFLAYIESHLTDASLSDILKAVNSNLK